ncbi:MAG: hypothetical protein QGI60_05830 [archaeon]|jgi:hypothetical protein|nr:hypothetical protein [archaeon]
MRVRNAFLIAIALLLFLSSANALWCGDGDIGGKLLGFTFNCFGGGEIILSCANGSDRGQCFRRQSCDVGDCNVGTSGRYGTDACRGNCGDTNSTSVSIVCEPRPLTNPVTNLPHDSYTGYLGQELTIEGFAGDVELIKDIYFEDVPNCDINYIPVDFNTVSGSVKAVFTCSKLFSNLEITLVAKDYCNAVSTETALLSIEEYCPKDCVSRNYPQCDDGVFSECFERRECAFIEETTCEFGCEEDACCVPSSCQDLNFECGVATGSCDENVSCGECSNGGDCVENKCVLQPTDQNNSSLLDQNIPELTEPIPANDFNSALVMFIGPIIAVIIVIIIIVVKVFPRGGEEEEEE